VAKSRSSSPSAQVRFYNLALKLRLKFIFKNLFFFNSKLNSRKLGFNAPLIPKLHTYRAGFTIWQLWNVSGSLLFVNPALHT